MDERDTQRAAGGPPADAPEPIRVFLLDDHEVVRRGVRELLDAEDDIEVVGEADTAERALARIPATRTRRRHPRRPASRW